MAREIQRGTSSNLLQDDKLKIQTQLALPVGDDFAEDETASLKLKANDKLAYKKNSVGDIIEIANQSDLQALSIIDTTSTPYSKSTINSQYPTAKKGTIVVQDEGGKTYIKKDNSSTGNWSVFSTSQLA